MGKRSREKELDAGTEATVPATPEELQACVEVLRRLRPEHLAACDELRSVGAALFKSHVLRQEFTSKTAVEFLAEVHGHAQMLKKLEKLQVVIRAEHEARCAQASSCGMNKQRQELRNAIEASRTTPALELSCAAGTSDGAATSGEGAATSGEGAAACTAEGRAAWLRQVQETAALPPGSFRAPVCNTCRASFYEQHHFYHRLCPDCAEFNYAKRQASADMTGMVCVVTGGRVRIGFQIVLKLLRAGATVLTTSRFKHDAALRYAAEPDFSEWSSRLEVPCPHV